MSLFTKFPGVHAFSGLLTGFSASPPVREKTAREHSRQGDPQPSLNGHGIADEQLFNRMLCMERRRTERTGDPFVLMLIDLNGLLRDLPQSRVTGLCHAIRSVTRDSDFHGWYSYPTTIGTIFTTLRDVSRAAVEKALIARSEAALSGALTPEEKNRLNISFHFFPEDSGSGATRLKSDEKLYPDITNHHGARTIQEVLKRILDVGGSMAAVILFSPIFLACAVLIKATSKGPVFFRQHRIGKFGKEFAFLKFRTMQVDNDPTIHQQYIKKLISQQAPAAEGGVFKITNDPRVTRLGLFLRKTSIDELPQFLNVLRGEMSIVGPRPPIPYEISHYKYWHRRRVIEVKPGITGLWQITGRSRTTFDEMVRLDIRYIRQQSIWLDLKIIVKTPHAMVSGEGAY